MTTPAVLDREGEEPSEGLLDALVTTPCARHDLRRATGSGPARPGKLPHGPVHVVQPKLHGPAEVAPTAAIFDAVEATPGLPAKMVKLGSMAEERRPGHSAGRTPGGEIAGRRHHHRLS